MSQFLLTHTIYREELNSETLDFRPHWFVKAVELSEIAYLNHSDTSLDRNGDLISDPTALETKRAVLVFLDWLAIHGLEFSEEALKNTMRIMNYTVAHDPTHIQLKVSDSFLEHLLSFFIATHHIPHYNALKAHFRAVFSKLASIYQKSEKVEIENTARKGQKLEVGASNQVGDAVDMWTNIALGLPAMLGLQFGDIFKSLFPK